MKGGGGKPGEMYRVICFSERGEIEEGKGGWEDGGGTEFEGTK